MAGKIDFFRIAAEGGDVAVHPGDRRRGVFDAVGYLDAGVGGVLCSFSAGGEAVVDGEAVVLQLRRNVLASGGEAAAVEPDHRGESSAVGRVIKVERAAVTAVGIRLGIRREIGNVTLEFVNGLFCGCRSGKRKGEQCGKRVLVPLLCAGGQILIE